MNQEKDIQFSDDEIDLMDYIKVLLKRKRLILAVLLVAVVAVGVLSILMPKVYKIDTILEIGWMRGYQVEPPLQVVGKIKDGIYGGYPGMKVDNPPYTSLVNIETTSKDPQKSKKILEDINETILVEHNSRINFQKKILERKIERLREKIDFLIQIPTEQEIAVLQLEINNLQEQIEGFWPTRVIKEPTISEKPVRPNPLLNIVIAAILGIFIGVFLAFFKEWWEKNRKKLDKDF